MEFGLIDLDEMALFGQEVDLRMELRTFSGIEVNVLIDVNYEFLDIGRS